LTKQKDNSLDFPAFEYTPAISNTVNGVALENEETDTQIEFMNQCLTHIFTLYPSFAEKINEKNRDELYKGFVSSGTDIYVFFDLESVFQRKDEEPEEIEEPEETKEKGGNSEKEEADEEEVDIRWGCLEEIILHKGINGISIHPDLATLFLKNPELYTIRNRFGLSVPIPHILYLCRKREDGSFENLFQEHTKDTDVISLDIIHNTINHPLFRRIYCFTPVPIAGYDPTLLRFVGFVEDSLYLLEPLPFETDKPIKGLGQAPCMYYKENNHSYWGFRNSVYFTQIL
jgi:hypothetical protein